MVKLPILFLISRLIFLAFVILASFFIPLREGYLGSQLYPTQPDLIWMWANFDGRHFLQIAQGGYDNYNFAYFPLYPLIIYLLGFLLPIPLIYIGILVSSLFFIFAMNMIYKIIKLDFDSSIAKLTLILVAFFPLAFFYHSVYADSLFLALSTTSFYFARRAERNKHYWFLSGIFGGLCILTRLSGIALIPALAVEWYLQNRRLFLNRNLSKLVLIFLKTGAIAVGLASLGLIIYMVYLQFFFGDFLLFQKSMSAWQQSKFILPPQTIFRYIKILLLVDKSLLVYWIAVFELVSLIVYLYLTWYVWRYIRMSYGIFMFVLLSLVIFTGTFAGTPRYLLHLFPGFLAMALILNKSKSTILKIGLFLFYIIFGFILTGLYTRGYFIT